MTTKNIIKAFLSLSEDIKTNINSEDYQVMMKEAKQQNAWFEKNQVETALLNLTYLIDTINNENLLKSTHFSLYNSNILIICAGNIPAVAFHDVMCVLISGAKAIIKLSSNDNIIIPFLLKRLIRYLPDMERNIEILNTKFSIPNTNYYGVIATGSNSSALIFKEYFKDIPHIIRKSRYSCAVIQTNDDISGLEDDICLFFGQGCRSISHLFVPKNYNFEVLTIKLQKYSNFANHTKYKNNLDYQKAIMIMNNIAFIDANSVLLRENRELYSPIGVVNYSYYEDIREVAKNLNIEKDNIQCVAISKNAFNIMDAEVCVDFGTCQKPKFIDYADGVNILKWLSSLK